VGYGKTRKQVMNIAESAREKGLLRKCRISDGWFRRFIENSHSSVYVRLIPLHFGCNEETARIR